MKYSFNTFPYSYLTGWLPVYSLEETISRLSRIGYDAIELGCSAPHAFPEYMTEKRIADIKKCLDDNGIECGSVCMPPGGQIGCNAASPDIAEREYYKKLNHKTAKIALALGCKTILVVPGWYGYGVSRQMAWETSRAVLKDIAQDAFGFGLTVVLEPTPEDSNLVNTADDVLQMISELQMPNVGGMLDTEHILFRKEIISDEIHTLGAKLKHIHVTDAGRIPPGAGRTDFAEMMRSLANVNFQGYITMETGFGKEYTPDEAAQTALRTLKRIETKINSEEQ